MKSPITIILWIALAAVLAIYLYQDAMEFKREHCSTGVCK